MADKVIIVEHNVETNEVSEIETTKDQLKTEISPTILAMREANAAKELARKAVFEKLGLTEEEIALIS
jgi:hypothetical protein